MTGRTFGLLAAGLIAACAVPPRDPFDRGTLAAQRGDLLEALRAFESVPATHPRRVEALVAANDAEARVRRSHEALLEGIVFRSEGRDREALASLQRARETWPRLPSIDAWIAATRDRRASSNVRVATPTLHVPAVDCEGEASAAPVVAAGAPNPEAGPARTAPSAGGVESFAGGEQDAVSLGLVAVEARLGHGELELAVIDLLELARRFPADARVQSRLVRVLHQRALLRYGQGALTTAIADWERVMSIQPDNRLVAALLDAVRAEAAAPPF